MLVAEMPDGKVVGHLWLALQRQPGIRWRCLDSTTSRSCPNTAAMGMAERYWRPQRKRPPAGVDSIGLNVFGTNLVARDLYQSAGYTVSTMQMRKVLRSTSDRDDDG